VFEHEERKNLDIVYIIAKIYMNNAKINTQTFNHKNLTKERKITSCSASLCKQNLLNQSNN